MVTIKKGVCFLGCIAAVCILFVSAWGLRNNKKVEKLVEAQVVSINSVHIETSPRLPDSLALDATVAYEEDGVIIESRLFDSVSGESKKNELVNLQPGDVITLYDTASGLKFYSQNGVYWTAIIMSTVMVLLLASIAFGFFD